MSTKLIPEHIRTATKPAYFHHFHETASGSLAIFPIDKTVNSVKLEGNWAKVAVVVKTTDKGSYAAIAIQVKNIAYKGK